MVFLINSNSDRWKPPLSATETVAVTQRCTQVEITEEQFEAFIEALWMEDVQTKSSEKDVLPDNVWCIACITLK